MPINVSRGDIVQVDLEGSKGSETMNDPSTWMRSAIVIQDDVNKHSENTIIIPLTSYASGDVVRPYQIKIEAAELGAGGRDSIALCEQIRTVDRRRLRNRKGKIPNSVITKIESAISNILGFPSVANNPSAQTSSSSGTK